MTAASTLRRAWLAVVLLAVVMNVIAFVSHEHPSAANSQDQTVVCDWCAAHTAFASPPQLPQVSQLVLIAVDDIVIVATLPLFYTPSLAAQPRGPPLA